MPSPRRSLVRPVVTGASAAGAVVLLDSVLARLPFLNTHPILRGAVRVAGGWAASEALSRTSQSPTVQAAADGLLVGPVMVSLLDVGVAAVGLRRVEPPPATSPSGLGAPWPPQPAWALPAGR